MKKILVIEDDLDTLDIIGFLLGDKNYQVIRRQKIIPLAEVTEIGPDIVLIDYRLPNGFGNELCLEIKTQPHTKHIPVILMSTHLQLKKVAKESCADAYLEKPFNIEDVINMVGQY